MGLLQPLGDSVSVGSLCGNSIRSSEDGLGIPSTRIVMMGGLEDFEADMDCCLCPALWQLQFVLVQSFVTHWTLI